MILTKHIEVGLYKLTITVESNSVESHSMMSDNKDSIENKMTDMQRYLRGLITNHIQVLEKK